MRNPSGPMLESETGTQVITTVLSDYPAGNSRNCSNAPGFHEATEQGGLLLLRTRRSSGWPHFPSPANLLLVDIPRRKWLLRRSRVSVGVSASAIAHSPKTKQRRSKRAGWGFD